MDIFVNELVGALSQLLIFSLIPVLVWLIAARKKETLFEYLGLKKIKCVSSGLKTFLLTLLVCVCYIGGSFLVTKFFAGDITAAGNQFAGKGMKAVPAALAYAFIRTALSEEIIFRGFILKRVASKWGFKAGNIVQALLFGLMHGVPFGLASGKVLVTVIMTVLPGAMGWYMGWMNEKRCGGSILPSWLTHGIMNFAITIVNL